MAAIIGIIILVTLDAFFELQNHVITAGINALTGITGYMVGKERGGD